MAAVLAKRFWSKVSTEDDCWEWTGVLSVGYGQIYHKGKMIGSHRVAWGLAHGPIPDGKYVLHACDNRRCVRVSHLFLGGPRENTLDCITKGRANPPRGVRHWKAKLNEAKVKLILRSVGKFSQAKIAALVGVNRTTVEDVVCGRTWKHIKLNEEEKNGTR